MKTQRLIRFDVWSVGKCAGVIYGVIGVIVGVCFFLFAIFAPAKGIGGRLGLVLIAVLVPVLYGILGFLLGALIAAVYNWVSRRGASISFITEETPPVASPQP